MKSLNLAALFLGMLGLLFANQVGAQDTKTWHIFATKDQQFKVEGQKNAVVTVKAGQEVHLIITAEKGSVMAKDGAVHSFTIKSLADQGWNIRLKEGTQEYTLKAPAKPGEYVVECTVLCGPHHADQRMKLVVTP